MSIRMAVTVSGLLLGMLLAACGPTKAGIEARENARGRLDAMNAQLSYDQAQQAFEVGRFERALREIAVAIERYPEAAAFYVLQGRTYLEMHKLERAVDAFQTAIEKDANHAEAHYYAGIVFQRWSDDTQAFEHYQAATDLDPGEVHYLLAAAEAQIALGDFGAARELVESKLEYFEHNAAMHHLLGQISLLEGDPQEAVERYLEARLLNPDDETLLEELARVQYEAEQYAQCLDSVTQLQLNLETPRSDLMLLEARCLTLLDRSTEARNLYLKLTQTTPADPSVWVELGTVAWDLGDFTRVAQCSVRLIALEPARFEGYMLKAVNERHHGNDAESVSLMREAVSHAPEAAMPRMLLGMWLEERGDREGALAMYEEALQVEPDNPEARVLFNRLSQVTSVPVNP